MEKNKDIQITLKGKQVFNPTYQKQELEEYCGNPCIEVLPRIFDDKETIENLLYQPQYSAEDCSLRANVRYHLINRVKDFFLPLDYHLKIEHILSSMIRRGYISRNPASREYVMRLNCLSDANALIEGCNNDNVFDTCKLLGGSILEIPELRRSTSECASVIGVSGMGKTQTIERLLLMYPQVIYHSEYNNVQLVRTQVTWLKIDCPFDGSIKTMCKMFFSALDDVLGNKEKTYFNTFGQNRNSTASMMIHMAQLACLHSIGMLVIDEIQHIIHPKNNPDEMLNFLATLINTIGIPIMLIGTPKVAQVLERGLKNARRAVGFGSVYWDRMDKTDEEWNFMLEVLWKYQWLNKKVEINNKLLDAIYYESQGIIAVAVTLFLLAQKQAIFERKEELSAGLITRVANTDMRVIQKLIRAIRKNDIKEICEYEDISINVENILTNNSLRLTNIENIREVTQQQIYSIEKRTENQKEQIIAELKAINAFSHLSDKKYNEIVSKAMKNVSKINDMASIKKLALLIALDEEKLAEEGKSKSKESRIEERRFDETDLRSVYYDSRDLNIHVYEKLLEKGYIKKPMDDYKIADINS